MVRGCSTLRPAGAPSPLRRSRSISAMKRSMSLFDVFSIGRGSLFGRGRGRDGDGFLPPVSCDALTTALMIHTSTNNPRTTRAIPPMNHPRKESLSIV